MQFNVSISIKWVLRKIKNDLLLLKSQLTIQLTLTSKTLPKRLILEEKNTDNKYKAVKGKTKI